MGVPVYPAPENAASSPTGTAPRRASGFPPWAPALLLALATLLVYLPSRNHGYVAYDDDDYVVNNPRVLVGLGWDGVAWAFGSGYAGNWHPVTWLSHMADASLFGPGPAGAHMTNVVLHAANTALVFWVLLSLCGAGAIGRCAWVAALFGLHPLHVESVAWVAERKDVLSAFFFLLTLAAWGHYARVKAFDRGVARGWYAAALGFFALGLMSKPMLVTLPCVLLLLDHWPLRRLPAGSWAEAKAALPALLREKLPFFALSLASCVVTFLVQRQSGAVRSLESFTLPERAANALVAYALYLRNTVWPAGLAVFYPHPGTWPPAAVLAAAGVVGALSFLALRGRQMQPFVTTGWFWFTGMLVPAIGLVQVGNQALADRYTYLPLIGVFLALAWAAADATERRRLPRAALVTAAVLPVLACTALTRAQLAHWQDSETLFRRAIAVTKKNALAHNNLGNALLDRGQADEAIAQFEQAITIRPAYADAHCNLGNALLEKGRTEEAAGRFRRALELEPRFAEAHYNLGNLLLQGEAWAEAEAQFRQALDIQPDYALARNNLGNALLRLGRVAEGVGQLEKAVALRPDFAPARHNLGSAYLSQGRGEAALRQFRAIVEIQPANANAHNNLGWLLRKIGRDAEAVESFHTAVELRPDYAEAHDNLAKALLAGNRVEEALAHCQTALRLQPGDPITLATLASIRVRLPGASSAPAPAN